MAGKSGKKDECHQYGVSMWIGDNDTKSINAEEHSFEVTSGFFLVMNLYFHLNLALCVFSGSLKKKVKQSQT